MNLQENYKRLFKGKSASNDGSVLFESRYNVKVKKHQELKSYDDDLEKLRVEYKGTISGPDIPNGTEWWGDLMPPRVKLIKLREHGEVAEIRQDVVHVIGLSNCMNGQLVRIGPARLGVIVG